MDTFGSSAVCISVVCPFLALDAPTQNNIYSLDAQKTSEGAVSHPGRDSDAECGITVTKVWPDRLPLYEIYYDRIKVVHRMEDTLPSRGEATQ